MFEVYSMQQKDNEGFNDPTKNPTSKRSVVFRTSTQNIQVFFSKKSDQI